MKLDRFLVLGITLIVAGAVMFVALQLTEDRSTTSPLYTQIPQAVLSQPPIYPGGTVSIKALKCNRSDTQIAFQGDSYWRSVDVGEQTILHRVALSPLVLGPQECLERVFMNKLPDSIPPGRWRLQGIDCLVDKPSVCTPWYSEIFQIIEGKSE